MTHRVITIRSSGINDALKAAQKARDKSPWEAFRKKFWNHMKTRNFTGPILDYKAVGVSHRAAVRNVGMALAFEAFKDKNVMDQLQAMAKDGYTHVTVNARGEIVAEKLGIAQKNSELNPKKFYSTAQHVPFLEIFNMVKDHKGAKVRSDLEKAGTPIGFAKPKPKTP